MLNLVGQENHSGAGSPDDWVCFQPTFQLLKKLRLTEKYVERCGFAS
jgi:hypothetical protein